MARKKNTTFTGSVIADVDIDALTFQRAIENAIGDTALVFDKVTGSNGEANTINHGGTAGRGSLLGVPVAQQYIGRRVNLDYTAGGAVTDKFGGGGGQTWLIACPVFIPPGETEMMVEVTAYNLGDVNLVAYFRTSVFATVGDAAVKVLEDQGDGIRRALFSGLTSGLCLFFVDATTRVMGTEPYLQSWRIYPRRDRSPRTAARSTSQEVGVTTPAATEGVANVAFDSSLFAPGVPLHGYLTAKENRNQNGLTEYITGWPAADNAAYTHVDHDGAGAADAADPARSRFLAHTRSLYAAEPEIAWPLGSWAFGAFRPVDGGFVVNALEPPTYGMLNWYAPWPTAGTVTTMSQMLLQMPDFQTSASRLKMAMLVGSDAGLISDWDGRAGLDGAVGIGAFAAVTGTTVAGRLGLATATALAFTGDGVLTTDAQALAVFRLVKTRSAGAARSIKSIALLGACLYFEP